LITDLAVFTIDKQAGAAALIEIAKDVTLDEIKAKTEASFKVAV
jgi:3-oxoacid CoA-transferase subunit B